MKESGDAKIAAWLEPHVFGHRKLILVIFALVTVALGWIAATGLKLDTNFNKQLPLQHEYIRTYLDHKTEFGGANRLLIAVVARDGTCSRRSSSKPKDRERAPCFLSRASIARACSLSGRRHALHGSRRGRHRGGGRDPLGLPPEPPGSRGVRENILRPSSSDGWSRTTSRRHAQRATARCRPGNRRAGRLHRDLEGTRGEVPREDRSRQCHGRDPGAGLGAQIGFAKSWATSQTVRFPS